MDETDFLTTFVIGDGAPAAGDAPRLPGKGKRDSAVLVDASGARHTAAVSKIGAAGMVVEAGAMMRVGDALTVELDCGQRRLGRIDWRKDGEAGVTFAEPVDIVALINRNLIAQPAERRRMPRVEIRCLAHVKWCENLEPAQIRNISSSGLQLEGERLPPPGTLASLFVEGLNLPAAEAMWSRGKLAGFEFFEEVAWSSLVAWIRAVSRGH